MPHAFRGAIIAPKCQDLICDFVMWTHGPREGGHGRSRGTRTPVWFSRCGGPGVFEKEAYFRSYRGCVAGRHGEEVSLQYRKFHLV